MTFLHELGTKMMILCIIEREKIEDQHVDKHLYIFFQTLKSIGILLVQLKSRHEIDKWNETS